MDVIWVKKERSLYLRTSEDFFLVSYLVDKNALLFLLKRLLPPLKVLFDHFFIIFNHMFNHSFGVKFDVASQ